MSQQLDPVDHSIEQLQCRFGRNLRAARIRAGLSQKAVAELAGTTQSYLSQVELGQANLSLQFMAHLADGVGVSVETLLIPAGELTTVGDLADMIAAAQAEIASLRVTSGDRPITAEMLGRVLRAAAHAVSSHARKGSGTTRI